MSCLQPLQMRLARERASRAVSVHRKRSRPRLGEPGTDDADHLEGKSDPTLTSLLDTGAAVNVLPYGVGTQLGLLWDQQTSSVQLSGNLASVEARVVLIDAAVARFPPIRLAFEWARQDSIPVILGQVNFFMEFGVCFFRSRFLFEVQPKT